MLKKHKNVTCKRKLLILLSIIFLCTSCIKQDTPSITLQPTSTTFAQSTITTAPTKESTNHYSSETPTTGISDEITNQITPQVSVTDLNNSIVNPSAEPNTLTQSVPTIYIFDQSESSVRYGVGETFINQNNRYNYAIGTTNIISGEINVNFNQPNLTNISDINIDIKSFQSDKLRRDNAIRDRWLESSKFPIATFSPQELLKLPDEYEFGEEISFQINGNLLVRDIIQPVSFEVTLTIIDDKIIGNAQTTIKMTDFGFDPPDIAGILIAENEVDIYFDFVAISKDNSD
tara:strand:- start:2367 stop:3233 length:867 start_codon:yes stop_codon:yes gene_type:complete